MFQCYSITRHFRTILRQHTNPTTYITLIITFFCSRITLTPTLLLSQALAIRYVCTTSKLLLNSRNTHIVLLLARNSHSSSPHHCKSPLIPCCCRTTILIVKLALTRKPFNNFLPSNLTYCPTASQLTIQHIHLIYCSPFCCRIVTYSITLLI